MFISSVDSIQISVNFYFVKSKECCGSVLWLQYLKIPIKNPFINDPQTFWLLILIKLTS